MPGKQHQPSRVAPRLYLVTPPVGAPSDLPSDLGVVLAEAKVAAVLLRLAPADERSLVNLVKTIARPVQQAGVALVIDGHQDLVGRAGADGAHLDGLAALQSALPGLKPDRIAGAGGLTTRHDAMVAAEVGADYVMFGEPVAGRSRPAFSAVLDRVEWWSSLFQVPCVGYAETMDEIGALAAAGAEFVALGGAVVVDGRGLAAVLVEASGRLAGEAVS